ncbi:hypothetical protein HBB16_10495 [Pseudonocardia sp. MCCB 268]|nr:hypothetical protein [Pseudonocardia cytotoxica]
MRAIVATTELTTAGRASPTALPGTGAVLVEYGRPHPVDLAPNFFFVHATARHLQDHPVRGVLGGRTGAPPPCSSTSELSVIGRDTVIEAMDEIHREVPELTSIVRLRRSAADCVRRLHLPRGRPPLPSATGRT